MCGCPVQCKRFFQQFVHVIGYGHVSVDRQVIVKQSPKGGPQFATFHMPRAGMAMRRSGPYQCHELEALWEGLVFLTSIWSIICPYCLNVLLTSHRALQFTLSRSDLDNLVASSSWPKLFGRFCLPAQLPRAYEACVPTSVPTMILWVDRF